MGKTAIVLGATGVVGREVVDLLADNQAIDNIVTITRRNVEHSSAKVHNHIVDFEQLDQYPELFKGDFLFSCLGTTLKQAGSIAAQRKVDFDYQYVAATLAAGQHVPHYLLVSSVMADPESRSPYLKMKGELEREILQLPFRHISIFRPSVLLGEREGLRIGETIASWVFFAVSSLPFLRKYRPITGEQVAKKMVAVSQNPNEAVEILAWDEIF